MRIQKEHGTDKSGAKATIDRFLDGLMQREWPAGVKIKDATKSWNGDTMRFSFKAKKGFLGATISGSIQVTDNQVVLDSNLPGTVTTFVSEQKITGVINQQFDALFGLA